MTTYTVTATREGAWWLLEAPEAGAYGQAATLKDAASAARDIIALALDIEPEDVTVTIVPVADAEAVLVLEEADRLAAQADELKARAAQARSAAVKGFLDRTHAPYREAAAALHMSPQRVHQLAKG